MNWLPALIWMATMFCIPFVGGTVWLQGQWVHDRRRPKARAMGSVIMLLIVAAAVGIYPTMRPSWWLTLIGLAAGCAALCALTAYGYHLSPSRRSPRNGAG